MRISARWSGLSAVVLLLPAPPTARAATATVVTAGLHYAPPQVTVDQGDSLELLNVDPVPHNVVSLKAKGGRLLFTSATIGPGERAPVTGVEKLAPGSYGFYCSVHPEMLGTLVVRGPGTAAYAPVPTGATVPSPTSVAFHGDSLYVASYLRGTVERLPVLPGGALGAPTSYVTGLTSPLGIAFGPDGTLYVSDSRTGDDRPYGRVRAVPPGGGDAARAPVVVDDLPNGRHATNGLLVHGGRLYVANGNATDDGVDGGPAETPLSGTILSVPLTARNVTPKRPTGLVVEARGLRNPYDLAVRPGTDEVWTATNGPDRLDPYGEDLLHVFRTREPTVDFGFPACVYAATPTGPKVGQNAAVQRRCDPRHRPPEALLGLHTSANGLAFAPRTGGWGGDLFVARYGANGAPPTGHDVVRVPLVGGRAATPEVVLRSATPLDLAFGPAGLYVADFATGQITMLVPVG